ncbi:MAG: Flp family type IVb pilin [Chloroflexota bacterium]|nr:Flp family type IVb pilin [Chloroflexota bacterium]
MSWNLSLTRERGQGLAEYALILSLIAIFVIGALTFMGDGIAGTLSNVGNAL